MDNASAPAQGRANRGSTGWRMLRWPWVGMAALLVPAAVGMACVALPERQAVQPVPAREVAARTTLVGAQGPVAPSVKAGDLARLKAEGKGALMQRQLAVLVAQGDKHLYRGNHATLLIDGPETFAAMKAAVAAARERVYVEFYIVEDGGVAAEMAELLVQKAAAGVSVALLYDSFGSMATPKQFFDQLRAGGVQVCAFNPVNPLHEPGRWGLLQRNHRKMLAVDSEVAFIGGINLSNVYAEGSLGSAPGSALRRPSARQPAPAPASTSTSEGWRDTQVELRGPVVPAMTALFRASWAAQRCTGNLPDAAATPATLATAATATTAATQAGQGTAQAARAAPGQRIVKLVAGDPAQGVNPTYTILLAAIDAAQRSVSLTMAYFAPGPDFVQALADAARRGVDVRLVLPGRSDVSLVLHAARSYYAQLMDAGVQVHEMQHAVMHAKTVVVDGVLSSVGSSNLDWRSIVGNSEIDVMVLGEDFGQQLDDQFRRDVDVSQRIDPGVWQQRGLSRRLLERFGRLVQPLL